MSDPDFPFLPKGSCQCVWAAKSVQPSQRRRRRRNDTKRTTSQPTLLLIPKKDKNGSTQHILCRWNSIERSSGESQTHDAEESLLAFDDSVQVVDGDAQGGAMSTRDVHAIFQDDISATLWPLTDLQTERIDRLCGYCRSKSIQQQHQHVQIRKNSADTHSTLAISLSCAYPLEPEAILPLQTVKISVEDASAASVLLQTYWKRQLVGKVLVHASDVSNVTSRIRLVCPAVEQGAKDVGKDGTFGLVESLTTTPNQSMATGSKNNNLFGSKFYLVLPSTRITVVTMQRPLARRTSSLYWKDPAPSTAAKTLLETILCTMEGKNVPRTFLLSGTPGTGKTFSVRWAWQEAQKFGDGRNNVSLFSSRGSELLQTANPAKALKQEFHKATALYDTHCGDEMTETNSRPNAVLIFLDECDALVTVEPIAAILADLLDRVDKEWKQCMVVGATNRIDSIPSFLRRAGRFDREIQMAPPTVMERTTLLKSLIHRVNNRANSNPPRTEIEDLDEFRGISDVEIREIAEVCVGYVPADLSALVRRAWLLSLEDAEAEAIAVSHLKAAQQCVGASALRDATLAAPSKMTWDAIAGDPGGAKTALRQAIEWPRVKARQFEVLGLQPPRGILLHGPPGCAKTTLARAAAGASGVAFLSLSPAQVYASSYVGEAEAVVRRAFTLARSAAPCILFFDEIDSILGSSKSNGGHDNMGGGGARGSSAEARVLSTFLNEMDGVDVSGAGKDGVLVLGATNRPWTLDAALLRPGRLGDKIIFLPPPDSRARGAILHMQFESVFKTMEDEQAWDWELLIELSREMTGAELVGACQEAKMRWMREEVLALNKSSQDQRKSVASLLQCATEALRSVKPILSDPQSLEEFMVFQTHSKASS